MVSQLARRLHKEYEDWKKKEQQMFEKGRMEGREEGLKESYEEGRQEGREEERRELFQHMHRNGMTVAQIAKLVSMEEFEVQSILKRKDSE